MDKTIPYIIIGVQKCGTTSLEKWMKKNKYNVKREEVLVQAGDVGGYQETGGIETYEGAYYHRTPILILRDPIKRIFSQYHYKQNHQQGDPYEIFENTLEKALDNHPELLNASNYEEYITKWKQFKPIILYFEDVIKWKDFPWETQCDCGAKMTKEDERIIRSHIKYQLHGKYL